MTSLSFADGHPPITTHPNQNTVTNVPVGLRAVGSAPLDLHGPPSPTLHYLPGAQWANLRARVQRWEQQQEATGNE